MSEHVDVLVAPFRRALDAVPHAWLVGAQVGRVMGFLVLSLGLSGLLPMTFAGPAGWGDAITGMAAPFVAPPEEGNAFASGGHRSGWCRYQDERLAFGLAKARRDVAVLLPPPKRRAGASVSFWARYAAL